MKKKILFAAAIFGATTAFGQIESKNGWQVLPEAGDIAISMDAVPVIDFALNAINIMDASGQSAQHPGYVSGFSQVLVGKYYTDANTAYRGKLAINTNSMTETIFNTGVDIDGDDIEWEDEMKTSSTQIIIGGGLEKRRGHNRLQGFYGGEVLIGFDGNSATNTYGLEMDEDNVNAGLVALSRVDESKSGTGITFGLRGFGGVEYFFAPKISIGAEFGWGLGLRTSPFGETTTTTWNAADTEAETETTQGSTKESSFGFGVDDGASAMLGGSAALMINFHF